MAVDKQIVDAEQLIVQHLDLWTSAQTAKSTAGRGSNNKIELTGIKKLRELILELAVRGKLVPQDPNDEPASELLKRITTEKQARVSADKLKKQKPLLPITNNDKPFELPDGWELIRFGDAVEVINGRAYKQHEMLEQGTPLLRVGNLFTSNEWYYSDLELEENKYIDNGDLIYAWSASFGPFIWEGERVIYHYHIWKLDIFDPKSLAKEYLYNYLAAATEKIKASGNGIAMLHMTKERMEQLVLPVPPYSEQKRISERLKHLMSLCDQLEQQSYQSIDAHNQLVDTLLQTLVDSANADELASNWQRLSEHFDTLFTTEYSIDALKQTILQLAVMGKLVKQDPTDEPASELLKRIAKEKDALIKAGKIKKQKPLPPITDDEKPFALPFGWKWVRVGDVLSLKNGFAFKSQYFVENKTKHILTTPGNFYEKGGFRHRGDKTKYYNGPVDSEYVLAPGELIIPMTEQAAGLLGSAAFVPSDEFTYLHNQRLGKLTPHSEITTLDFVYVFFNSPFLREELASTCTGMKVRHTSPDRILEVPFPVMSSTEQLRIVSMVDKLMMFCDLLASKINSVKKTQAVLAETLVVHVV